MKSEALSMNGFQSTQTGSAILKDNYGESASDSPLKAALKKRRSKLYDSHITSQMPEANNLEVDRSELDRSTSGLRG